MIDGTKAPPPKGPPKQLVPSQVFKIPVASPLLYFSFCLFLPSSASVVLQVVVLWCHQSQVVKIPVASPLLFLSFCLFPLTWPQIPVASILTLRARRTYPSLSFFVSLFVRRNSFDAQQLALCLSGESGSACKQRDVEIDTLAALGQCVKKQRHVMVNRSRPSRLLLLSFRVCW